MKARLPKEYRGGGGGDMNSMIKQAQKIQADMEKKQEEINLQEFTAAVGGGVIEVMMTGNKELRRITINPDVVDPDDVEMLQDLVVAAVNEVYRKVDETTEAEIGDITGGLGVPGMV